MKARRYGIWASLAIVAAITSGALLAQAPQAIGTWVSIGDLSSPLTNGASVALPDKRTLIAGGALADGTLTDAVTIYDSVDDSAAAAGTLTSARADHTATLLKDGRVLVVGGMTADGLVSSDIEIFDPATGTSAIVALLPEPRNGHVAAALPNGNVLIAGGATVDGAILQTAVLFDPETSGVFSVPGHLHTARVHASATTMLDGRVLVAGGSNGTTELASAEIYDRYSQSFSMAATQMSVGRQGHSAVLLPDNGGVLVAGGTSSGVAQAGVDVFLPAVFPDPFSYGEGEFASTGAMTAARTGAVAGPTSVEGYAFAAAGGSPDAEVYRYATIKTDKDDYPPGELAVITGSGWQANEEVTLTFQEDPAVHDDYVLKVKADGSGNIYWNQWAPEAHDANVRFYLLAQGAASRAQMTFTDSVASVTITSPTNATPQTITSLPATVTVSFSYATSTTGPTSGTADILGTSLSATKALTPGTQTDSITVTVPVGTPNGTYNIKVTVNNSTGSGSNNKNDNQNGAIVINVPSSAATSTLVASSANPSTYGGGVPFTATVTRTAGTGTPTGSVQFKIDGSNFGVPVTLGAPSSTTFATAVSTSINTLTATTHTVEAVYIPTGSFAASSDLLDGGQVVNKANAVCTINGHNGAYDGAAHGATGSCVGVASDPTAAGSTVNLGSSFTDAPGGTASWSFTGGTNYNNQSGSVAITINKADANVVVNGYTGTYDAAAHGATGTATGVGGADLSANLNLGSSFTDAPGGTANWTFTGGTNYNGQSGTAAIVINKADAHVVVDGYTGIYDANAHGATGTATGVGGVDLSATLDLGETFTNVPGGTANWTFTGGTNYNGQSGTAAIVINKADAHVVVDGYTGIYDANAHGATGTATGVGGVDLSATLDLGETFTNVPGGTANWTFTGGTNYNGQSGTAAIVINKADAHVVVDGYTGIYDANAHGATGTATGVGGVDLSATLDLGETFTNVPGGTANWTFTGGTNYNGQSGTAAIVINKADAHVVVNGYTGTYDALAHGATGSATGVSGVDLSATLDLGEKFTDAPGGTAHWAFSGGTNYNDQSSTAAIVINKADAHVVVNGYTGTYDALAHGATGSATGIGGVDLSATLDLGEKFTDAPGGTAHWTFIGGTNHNDQSGTAAIVINKADAHVVVNGYTGIYDAHAHGATGTAIGVDDIDLGGALTLGETFTNAPGGTANWTFTGGTNYKDQSGSVAISINKADATITVNGYTGIYDAHAHGATGSATGVGDVDLSAGLTLGATFTNFPGGTANWTFTGGTNYNDQSGTAAIVINKADAIVSVSAYTGTFDGNAHGASGTATGVGDVDLAAGLNLGASFTDAPGGSAHWTFADLNYKPQSSDVQIVIDKASSTTTINCPENVTYTGDAQTPCTVTVKGAGGLNASPTASYTNNVNAGTATASYEFAGDTNHTGSPGNATFVINKANAVVTVNGYTGVFDGHTHGATGTVLGVKGEPLAGLNLSGSFISVPGGTANWAFTDQTGNYNHQSGDVAIVITKADPTVSVSGYGGVYNGQPHGATGTAKGVLGESLAGLVLGATFTNVPGGMAHWAFTDVTGNYNDKSGDVEIEIYKANATCSITGYDVIFDNASHTATGSCTGVNNASLAGLGLSGTSHKDAGVYTDAWTFTDVTGNYNNTGGPVVDQIGHWTTGGFYQPVDMSGAQIVWNTVKGGSTVPLKFNLYAGSVKKTTVSDVAGFAFAPAPCEVSMIDAAVEFTTTGGTELRYDGTAGQFIQNWQTPKTTGKCYVVQLTALDGSTIAAYFKTK